MVTSIVSGHCSLLYVSCVPHCSQNCRTTGRDDLNERTGPERSLNESRETVAQATA